MTKFWVFPLSILLACSSETLQSLTPETTLSVPDYDRTQWKHWTDADLDCQDTRQEVLIRDSQGTLEFKDERKCQVTKGLWVCPYTGQVITDPSLVDIDHRVALSDAHESGGWGWSLSQKEQYANQLEQPKYLVATSQFGNRSKSNRGPAQWLPPLATARCRFIQDWVEVKTHAGLRISPEDQAVISYMRKICEDGGTPPLPQ
jgi:hypothetical protein